MVGIHPVGAAQASCPAFGGPDLTDLYVTTASENAPATDVLAGALFRCKADYPGLSEPKVIL